MIDTVGWKSGRHARAISLPVFTGLRGPFDVTRHGASRDQPVIAGAVGGGNAIDSLLELDLNAIFEIEPFRIGRAFNNQRTVVAS